MLTKQQVVEILEAALNHPSYLGQGEEHHCYFCYVVEGVCCEKGFSYKASEYIQDGFIYPSIDHYGLLRMYLVDMGRIPQSTTYDDPEYKVAAFEHWTNLIEKVKGEV